MGCGSESRSIVYGTKDFSLSVLSGTVQSQGVSGTDSFSCNNLHLFISIVKIDLIPFQPE